MEEVIHTPQAQQEQINQSETFEWNQQEYEDYLKSPECAFAKKLEVSKAYKDVKEAKSRYNTAVSALSTEESRQKAKDMMDIVKRKQNSILDNPVSKETQESVLKLNTTEAEEELYNSKKNSPLYSTKELISELKEHSVFGDLKKIGSVDLRSQRHMKKPAAYLDKITSSKILVDLVKRMEIMEEKERLRDELHEKEKGELNRKFEVVGLAVANLQANVQRLANEDVTLYDKINFLHSLGVDVKKVSMYQARFERPDLTQRQLGELFGKTDRTVRNWMLEIENILLTNSTM